MLKNNRDAIGHSPGTILNGRSEMEYCEIKRKPSDGDSLGSDSSSKSGVVMEKSLGLISGTAIIAGTMIGKDALIYTFFHI